MSARHHSASGRAVGSYFRPRTIRWKLTRILLVSLAIALGLLGVAIANAVGTSQSAGRLSDSVHLTLQVQELVHQLQRERGLSSGLLGGNAQFRSSLDAQRGLTDTALADVQGVDAIRAALAPLSELSAVRGTVDAGTADRTTNFQYYTDTIGALMKPDLGSDQAQDPVLRRSILALQALGEAKEYTGQERGFMSGVFAAGRFQGTDYQRFMEIRADKQAALAQFARQATEGEQAELDAALNSAAATEAAGYETTALGGGSGALPAHVDSAAWYSVLTKVIDDMRTVQLGVGDDSVARAARISHDATVELIALSLVAVLAVALELALVIAAARSITTPLAALAREADQVADDRLPRAVAKVQAAESPPAPEPLGVGARAGTEIQLVAAAFDRVQRTAFELAGEQAVLRQNTTESLSNLGRRNQNLLRRQIGLISEFEEKELDPDALAKLFQLDHLATRMRRNAESLLVLVGEPGPRRIEDPVPVTDIIRAALSEVEEYHRVVLRRVDEMHIVGTFATELTHMLAELLENALNFSPPGVEVEVYGRDMPPYYLLAVVDHGVGMPTEAFDRANARLRGDERFLIAPTRFLGHYVVGKLAERLGADVRLLESPSSGTTARISLPGQALVREVPQPQPAAAAPERINMFEPVREIAPVPNGRVAEGGRTRNGLAKRVRKNAPRPVEPVAAPEEPVLETRSPENVRTMLASFRVGHERGRLRGETTPSATIWPEEDIS